MKVRLVSDQGNPSRPAPARTPGEVHTDTGMPPVAAQIAAERLLAPPSTAWASGLDGSERSPAICVMDRPWNTPGEKPMPDPDTMSRFPTSTKGSVAFPGTYGAVS